MTAVSRRRELRDRFRPAMHRAARNLLLAEKGGILKMVQALYAARVNVDVGLSSYLDARQADVAEQASSTFGPYVDLVRREAQQEVGYRETVDLTGFLSDYSDAFSRRFTGSLADRVQKTVDDARQDGADVVEAVAGFLAVWLEQRSQELAAEESVRLGDATAYETYRQTGVTQLRWHASGSSCPYCSALNGRVVGIEHHFLAQGEPFKPEAPSSGRASWAAVEARAALEALIPSTNVRHAPAHRGCDCMVVAA
jgi:hypothetical protein